MITIDFGGFFSDFEGFARRQHPKAHRPARRAGASGLQPGSLIKRRRRNEPELCRYQNYIEFGFLAIIALMLKGPETNYPVTSIATLALATMALLGLILLRRSVADRLFASLSAFTILLAVMLMLVSVTGYIPTFGMAKLGRDATFRAGPIYGTVCGRSRGRAL